MVTLIFDPKVTTILFSLDQYRPIEKVDEKYL